MELNKLTKEIIYALFTVRHTLSSMCSVHNHFGRDHYALRPMSPELCAEVSKECCPNSPGRIHYAPTSPVSELHRGRQRPCRCLYSTDCCHQHSFHYWEYCWHNTLFQKDFSSRITQGCAFSGLDRSRNSFFPSEQSRLCFVGLKFACFRQSWLRRELKPTTFCSILTTVGIIIECCTINHYDVRF